MAKYRGRVYGMGGPSPATRRKNEQQQRLKYNMQHVVMLNSRKQIPEINIWQSDFQNNNPNICEFCKMLNATWFHQIKNSQQNMHLSTTDFLKIKEMYLQQVYTASNFPVTWRNIKTWRDANGQSLKLQDITEEDIKTFYFKRCPRDPAYIMDVISFLGTVVASFFGLLMLGAFCV
jgi:hypothetical protein